MNHRRWNIKKHQVWSVLQTPVLDGELQKTKLIHNHSNKQALYSVLILVLRPGLNLLTTAEIKILLHCIFVELRLLE